MDKLLDHVAHDRGCYRTVVKRSHDGETPVILRSTVIDHDAYEDALIEALDAGMTAEEIAAIQLGSTS